MNISANRFFYITLFSKPLGFIQSNIHGRPSIGHEISPFSLSSLVGKTREDQIVGEGRGKKKAFGVGARTSKYSLNAR